MRTLLTTTIAAVAMVFGMSAQAQDSGEDEIIVEGQIRTGDDAMGAFFAGDFETAEIEFERNIRIIKRGQSEIQDLARNATSQSLLELGAQATSAGGQNSPGQVLEAPNLGLAPQGFNANNPEGVITSGRDMGFQYYMAGLSELQLGKVDEAEDSFKSAVHHNKTLYDARMRFALIRLGKGDVEFAREQHQRLYRDLEKCNDRCPRPEELEESEATLRNILAQVR